MKGLYGGLIALVLLPGCVQKNQERKKKAPVAHATQVRSSEFIIPSKALSALSAEQECAFLFATSKKTKQLSSLEYARQCEARLVDIPVPIAVKPLKAFVDEQTGQKILSYSSSWSADQVKIFYIQEMERFGWQQEYIFDGSELLLSFKKPERYCAICVRPAKKEWHSSKHIFISVFVSS